jgi:hypothetical protein
MGIDLPNPRAVFLPEVPSELAQLSPELFNWAKSMRTQTQKAIEGAFDNALHTTTAINSGTSGTFTLSSGGSIVVTSGIVINVTS